MRLIDVDDLGVGRCSKDVLPAAYCAGWNGLLGLIEKAPTVDAVPVVHARWIRPHWRNSNYCCDCSECGGEAMHRDYRWNKNGIYPICPNCGAMMDGGNENV